MVHAKCWSGFVRRRVTALALAVAFGTGGLVCVPWLYATWELRAARRSLKLGELTQAIETLTAAERWQMRAETPYLLARASASGNAPVVSRAFSTIRQSGKSGTPSTHAACRTFLVRGKRDFGCPLRVAGVMRCACADRRC